MYSVKIRFVTARTAARQKEYFFDSVEDRDFFVKTIEDFNGDIGSMGKILDVLQTRVDVIEETDEEVTIEFVQESKQYYKVRAHVATQSQNDLFFQDFWLDSPEAALAFSRGVKTADENLSNITSYISGIRADIDKNPEPAFVSQGEQDAWWKGYVDVGAESFERAFLHGALAVGDWDKLSGSSLYFGASLDLPVQETSLDTGEFIRGGFELESDEFELESDELIRW